MIRINPPPKDAKCECCGRSMKIAGSLRKDFRKMGLTGEAADTVEARWHCVDCFSLPDEEYFEKRRRKHL